MERRFSELQRIAENETITEETHYEFLCHLQWALLLALREQGRLSAMQYHYAEERWKQQRIARAKDILAKGEKP